MPDESSLNYLTVQKMEGYKTNINNSLEEGMSRYMGRRRKIIGFAFINTTVLFKSFIGMYYLDVLLKKCCLTFFSFYNSDCQSEIKNLFKITIFSSMQNISSFKYKYYRFSLPYI